MLYLFIIAVIVFMLSIFNFYTNIRNHSNYLSAAFIFILSVVFIVYTGTKLPATLNTNANMQKSAKLSSKTNAFSKSLGSTDLSDLNSGTNNTQVQNERQILKSLKTNLTSIGTVSFNSKNKTYNVVPTNANFVKPFRQIIKNPSLAEKANYSSIQNNFETLSSSIQKGLGNGYTLTLNNPDQTNEPILVVKNGSIIKDKIR